MNRKLLFLLLVSLWLPSSVNADGISRPYKPPPEFWLPIEIRYANRTVLGTTTPLGILYFGYQDPWRNETAAIQVRLHERSHFKRMRREGPYSFYRSYLTEPGWACEEELRAGYFPREVICR